MDINTNVEKATTHTLDLSDRLYKIILGLIGVTAVFLIGTAIYQFRSLPQNMPNDVTVTGEGKAIAKPDIALISLGVREQAAKSQDAVNASNIKMNNVIAAVKALGVEDKDIQTTYYNLSPMYGMEVMPMGAGASPEGRPMAYPSYPIQSNKVTGYALEQQIQVKIRNFDNINLILDAGASKGANVIGSLYFTVDDMEKIKAEAREKAIAQAKEKANTLFDQAGLRIQKLINVSEGYGGYPYGMGGAVALENKAAVAPDIQAGSMEITTTVTLTYRVK